MTESYKTEAKLFCFTLSMICYAWSLKFSKSSLFFKNYEVQSIKADGFLHLHEAKSSPQKFLCKENLFVILDNSYYEYDLSHLSELLKDCGCLHCHAFDAFLLLQERESTGEYSAES